MPASTVYNVYAVDGTVYSHQTISSPWGYTHAPCPDAPPDHILLWGVSAAYTA